MSEHSKTPWLLSSSFLICDDEARIIANCQPMVDVPSLAIPLNQADKNAAFIVRACNNHDALVEVLGWALERLDVDGGMTPQEQQTTAARLRASLKFTK